MRIFSQRVLMLILLLARVQYRLELQPAGENNYQQVARWLETNEAVGSNFERIRSETAPEKLTLVQVRALIDEYFAKLDYKQKNYTDALRKIQKISQYSPSLARYHVLAGKCFDRLKKPSEAISALSAGLKVIDSAPAAERENVKTYIAYLSAINFFRLNKEEETKQQIELALSYKPTTAFLRGISQTMRGAINLAGAFNWLEEVLSNPLTKNSKCSLNSKKGLAQGEISAAPPNSLTTNYLDDEDNDDAEVLVLPSNRKKTPRDSESDLQM